MTFFKEMVWLNPLSGIELDPFFEVELSTLSRLDIGLSKSPKFLGFCTLISLVDELRQRERISEGNSKQLQSVTSNPTRMCDLLLLSFAKIYITIT